MTILLSPDGTVELIGFCPLEDAEKFLQYLITDPAAAVDWTSCTGAHTSVIQILMVAKPTLRGLPENDFLRNHVNAMLRRQTM